MYKFLGLGLMLAENSCTLVQMIYYLGVQNDNSMEFQLLVNFILNLNLNIF
jgi:hypothetical protein